MSLDFKIRLDDFFLEYYEEDNNIGWISVKTNKERDRFPLEHDRSFMIGEYTLKLLRYIPDFYIDIETGEVGSRSEQAVNPAVKMEINRGPDVEERWVFEKFPGFNTHESKDKGISLTLNTPASAMKSYTSRVSILEGDEIVVKKAVRVNDPLKYKGYTIYQSSYDEKNLSWSGLQVVKDPGLPIVYIGFLLLMAGVLYTFYLKTIIKKRNKHGD